MRRKGPQPCRRCPRWDRPHAGSTREMQITTDDKRFSRKPPVTAVNVASILRRLRGSGFDSTRFGGLCLVHHPDALKCRKTSMRYTMLLIIGGLVAYAQTAQV